MTETKQDTVQKPVNKKVSVPSPIIIIFFILILTAIATYIVPAGVFDRVKDASSGRMVVDPNTFHFIAKHPASFFDVFKAVPRGVKSASSIVGFLMIIGGALNVMAVTGAIEGALGHVVTKVKGREMLMIPVLLTIMTCLSAFAGCSEEYIAFVPLIMAVSYALGFDSIVAVAMPLAAVSGGYGAGVTNAFTVGVAQSISGLPMFSGIELRLVMLVALIVINVTYTLWYARKIKKNPEKSYTYDYDQIIKETMDLTAYEGEDKYMTGRQKVIMGGFVVTIAVILVGVIKYGFYMDELAALFLMMAVFAGIVGRLSINEFANAFIGGVKNMAMPCMMVSLCKGVTLLMGDSKILDTIIHYLAGGLNMFPQSLLGFGMFIVQDVFNLVVPSGSGQAAITMPIMAPLADLVGMTRQAAVLAFQMGDAFTNMVTPASGTTMTVLTVAGIPLRRWWKFAFPLLGLEWIFAFVVMWYATITKIGPF